MIRYTDTAADDLQQEVRRIARVFQLRRVPRVLVTNGQIPPLLCGIGGRSCILLPLGLLERLDESQRTSLLAHELAHLRRFDQWIRWLELMTLGVYWWHPVSWWARRRIQQAEDECCDGWVLWAFPEYARVYAHPRGNCRVSNRPAGGEAGGSHGVQSR